MSLASKLEALATCLCAEVGGDDMCFCGVAPGEASYDLIGECGGDCGGQAWVRLAGVFPAEELGTAISRPGNCSVELNFTIEVGVWRCVEVAERGEAPTTEELLAAHQQQVTDMEAMRRAIVCCDALDERDVILGPWTPYGPSGGIVGGSWTLTLGEG